MSEKLILLIETATTSCSAGLSLGNRLIALKEVNEQNIHASQLSLFIEDVMKQSGKTYASIDAVAVSKGPGSYTGLRIGVSMAKGLCFALDIPLISVDTLEAMAQGMILQQEQGETLFIPMIDARRMEVYMSVFRSDLSAIEPVSAKVIDFHSFDAYAGRDIILFGDGSLKFREMFRDHPHIRFAELTNSASHLMTAAVHKMQQAEFEDTAYFEPFYLKDFIAGKQAKR
jgi:tRNA threonylcarbamoyladenosine biosynthesis protein TsaB